MAHTKVSIIGATFMGNRGAEAMLTTVIAQIRAKKPNTQFNVFSYYPRLDKELVHDPSIHVHSSTPLYLVGVLFLGSLLYRLAQELKLNFLFFLFPDSIRALAGSVALFDISGVSFIDGREIFLPFNCLTIFPALVLKVPLIKLSQALGPFKNNINRLCARIFLSRCQMVYARGKDTYRHLRELGIMKNKYKLSTDIAFLHEVGHSLTKENERYFEQMVSDTAKLQKRTSALVGICLSSVVYLLDKQKDAIYLETIRSLVTSLVENGYGVVLFPNATLPSKTLRNNDLPVIDMIRASLDNKTAAHVISIEKCINADQIKRIIQKCDITVVSRFHAMIASLSCAVPVLVIGWSHKYVEIMEQFNQASLVVDYKKLHKEQLYKIVHLTLKHRNSISTQIRSRLNFVQTQAKKQIEEIVKFV